MRFAGFCGSVTAGYDCCRSVASQAGEGEQTLVELTRLCCIRAHYCIREHPGSACRTSRPGRGSPASLGSSQELFAGSGSRCAAAVGFLHTAVGVYAALDSLWCHSSPSHPFVEEMCLWGEAGQAPGGSACGGGCWTPVFICVWMFPGF